MWIIIRCTQHYFWDQFSALVSVVSLVVLLECQTFLLAGKALMTLSVLGEHARVFTRRALIILMQHVRGRL